MEVLNYKNLMEQEPTVYEEMINQIGQKVQFVEHPTKGEDYPVIAVFPEYEKAVVTNFFDCSDFYIDSDYNPCIVDDKVIEHYEL